MEIFISVMVQPQAETWLVISGEGVTEERRDEGGLLSLVTIPRPEPPVPRERRARTLTCPPDRRGFRNGRSRK